MSKKFSDFEAPSAIGDNDEVVGLGTGVNARWSFSAVGAYVQSYLEPVFTAYDIAITDLNYDVGSLFYQVADLQYEAASLGAGKVDRIGDTMSGPLHVAHDGGLGTESFSIGATSPVSVYASASGTLVFVNAGVVIGTWALGSIGISRAGGGSVSITLQGESTVAPGFERYSNDATAPAFSFRKYRGTIAAPAVVVNSDVSGQINWNAWNSASGITVSNYTVRMFETTPGVGFMGAQIRRSVIAPGGSTNTEIERLDHTGGYQAFGANTYLSVNRAFRYRSASLVTLNALTGLTNGDTFLCSDASNGQGALVRHNGTNFRRVAESGTQRRTTDAIFTLTPITSSPVQICTGVLATVDRAITLSTTGAYDGATFVISHKAALGFSYTVAYGSGGGSTKTIVFGTWAEFAYDGTAGYWDLIRSGTV